MKLSLQSILTNSIVRWWIVGIGFTIASIPLLYFLETYLHVARWLSSLVASEITTLLRYLINDRWVFGHPRPSWTRLWQYHVANIVSFIVWWLFYNLVGYLFSFDGTILTPFRGTIMEQTISTVIATSFSVGVSMASNFLWIWRSQSSGGRTKSPNSKTKSQLSLKNRRDFWR